MSAQQGVVDWPRIEELKARARYIAKPPLIPIEKPPRRILIACWQAWPIRERSVETDLCW